MRSPRPRLSRALKGISERRFPAGGYICHRGDKLDYWIGIVSGLLKISAISADGKAITFAGGRGGRLDRRRHGPQERGAQVRPGGPARHAPRHAEPRDLHVAVRDQRRLHRFLVHQFNERMGQFIGTIECDRIHDPTARVARHLAWLFNPVLYPERRQPHRDHAGGAGAAGRRVAAGRQQEPAAAGSRPACSSTSAAASGLSMWRSCPASRGDKSAPEVRLDQVMIGEPSRISLLIIPNKSSVCLSIFALSGAVICV